MEDPGDAPHAVGDDAVEVDGDVPPGPDPLTFDRWRRASATGAVMTGIALGLREALQVPREEAPIVEQVSGDPPGPPQPLEVRLDPDSPGTAVAVVRPWLMEPDVDSAGASDRRAEGDAPAP